MIDLQIKPKQIRSIGKEVDNLVFVLQWILNFEFHLDIRTFLELMLSFQL